MIHFLLAELPQEIVELIALFEGRVFRAYLRDYVSQVYSKIYKQYFGYRYSLKYITGGFNNSDKMSHLPYYTAWSTIIRKKHPAFVKKRTHKGHMRNLHGIIPERRLVIERKRLEDNLAGYFQDSTQQEFERRIEWVITTQDARLR
jgi:hypothetical protein